MEYLRWLTKRGTRRRNGGGRYQANRPVLRHAYRRHITEGEAKRLGAFGIIVYESPLRFNARSVEAKVQQRSHHHGLGWRLVRFPDKGAGGIDADLVMAEAVAPCAVVAPSA